MPKPGSVREKPKLGRVRVKPKPGRVRERAKPSSVREMPKPSNMKERSKHDSVREKSKLSSVREKPKLDKQKIKEQHEHRRQNPGSYRQHALFIMGYMRRPKGQDRMARLDFKTYFFNQAFVVSPLLLYVVE
ncbi:hypothetical protein chiPu_0011292 [Chiloscyllium punctatum]|uniref:Uncharacterized protein n=1 Tax=Chiloscyllium punctatum TaxID=137246 RepID=A0A401SR15_CHIPU|nr:hypothetical protein [Chiloscyllium punctatum]